MSRHCLSLSLIALVTSCATAPHGRQSAAVDRSELPITRVILYQNGVGYFEREGELQEDQFTLQVRQDQINDLLKSLTVIDMGEGRPVSVSLPLEKSQTQALAELPEQVRNAGGLLDVLRVFRGARVIIEGTDDAFGSPTRIAGRVLGTETLGDADGHRVTIKTESGSLIPYPVASIRRLIINDRTLEVGLEKSLDVSLDEGTWKPIGLTIKLTQANEHPLRVSYITEMPLWKPAYRVVLDAEGKPLLQGWAVVDNVSGEDWQDVKLSLVSGSPLSFIYDLHSPQYTQRVDLTPSRPKRAAAPVLEKSGYAVSPPPPPPKMKKSSSPRRSRSQKDSFNEPLAGLSYGDSSDDEMGFDIDMLSEEVEESAEGESVGSLFRYDLRDPVTIPDRTSTLVSIVNSRIEGEEIMLFRPDDDDRSHPYRSLRLTNDSGFTLERGPVTVYSSGTFVGEGFLERLEKQSTAFLTFSIDAQVKYDHTGRSRQENLKLVRIVDGYIKTEAQSIKIRSFEVENKHDHPITAVVKLERRSGKLRAPPTGIVETPDHLFVPLKVAAQSKQTLTLEWESKISRQIRINTDSSTTVLKLYLEGEGVPDSIRKVLGQVLDMKRQQQSMTGRRAQLEKTRKTLSRDQARVRQNLDLLRKTSGNKSLQQSLIRKLTQLEDQLGKISGETVELSEREAKMLTEMKVLISSVELKSP